MEEANLLAGVVGQANVPMDRDDHLMKARRDEVLSLRRRWTKGLPPCIFVVGQTPCAQNVASCKSQVSWRRKWMVGR